MRGEGFVIPVTIDDLAANGLLEEAHPQTCWERSVETLTARKDDIAGLAVASDERIEAYLLYVTRGTEETEIVSLRSFIEDGGARLRQLLAQLRAQGMEISGFRRSTPRKSRGSGWRRSVSRPRAGIDSTPRRQEPANESAHPAARAAYLPERLNDVPSGLPDALTAFASSAPHEHRLRPVESVALLPCPGQCRNDPAASKM